MWLNGHAVLAIGVLTAVATHASGVAGQRFVCTETVRQDCDAGLQICTLEDQRLTTWQASQNSLLECSPENRCTTLENARSRKSGDYLLLSQFSPKQRTVVAINTKQRTFEVFTVGKRRIFVAKGACISIDK